MGRNLNCYRDIWAIFVKEGSKPSPILMIYKPFDAP